MGYTGFPKVDCRALLHACPYILTTIISINFCFAAPCMETSVGKDLISYPPPVPTRPQYMK